MGCLVKALRWLVSLVYVPNIKGDRLAIMLQRAQNESDKTEFHHHVEGIADERLQLIVVMFYLLQLQAVHGSNKFP